MNKKLLIISPYFPPSNAADMQRIRTSLPYFKKFGWEAEVVAVAPEYSDVVKDDLLMQSIPPDVKIHYVKALNKSFTSKLGFGALAFRSLRSYRNKVSRLLKKDKFDLIYFSTTQFPVCILGAYWKKRFGVPYVIDMQDPWYSTHYSGKPKAERPPKYRIIYAIHKVLEAKAMKSVDGLISVSEQYIVDLRARYPQLKNVPSAEITFGAFAPDVQIAKDNQNSFQPIINDDFCNVVYIGRGGTDMHKAISLVFKAFKKGLGAEPEKFGRLKFWFIGTSYATPDKAVPTIVPLAEKYSVDKNVTEITGRISYYHALSTLLQADALFIPGSDDPKYTASKIYPYLLTQKPLLAIFNEKSNAVSTLRECTANATILTFDDETDSLTGELYKLLTDWADGSFRPISLSQKFENYSAENLTAKQVELFERAIKYHETAHTNA